MQDLIDKARKDPSYSLPEDVNEPVEKQLARFKCESLNKLLKEKREKKKFSEVYHVNSNSGLVECVVTIVRGVVKEYKLIDYEDDYNYSIDCIKNSNVLFKNVKNVVKKDN